VGVDKPRPCRQGIWTSQNVPEAKFGPAYALVSSKRQRPFSFRRALNEKLSMVLRFGIDVSESMASCERAPQSLYALASSTRSIPSSVSKARNPSAGVLSTSGIGDNDAIQRVDAPAAQEIHRVRPLLGPSRVHEVALPAGLHEHAVPPPDAYKAHAFPARPLPWRSSDLFWSRP
jgi:hypothetical protein